MTNNEVKTDMIRFFPNSIRVIIIIHFLLQMECFIHWRISSVSFRLGCGTGCFGGSVLLAQICVMVVSWRSGQDLDFLDSNRIHWDYGHSWYPLRGLTRSTITWIWFLLSENTMWFLRIPKQENYHTFFSTCVSKKIIIFHCYWSNYHIP